MSEAMLARDVLIAAVWSALCGLEDAAHVSEYHYAGEYAPGYTVLAR